MINVENLEFDTNLFGFRVGRIELSKSDLSSSSNQVVLAEALREAYASGTKLIYLLAPIQHIKSPQPTSPSNIGKFSIPGTKTDEKTTYELRLNDLKPSKLYEAVYVTNNEIKVRIENKASANTSEKLRDLAVASGEWSRFRLDTNIPTKIYEAVFEAWVNNSVNRSIADEVFVATTIDGEDVGFVTVKRKGNIVNIGLLAVDSNYRRRGIARMLLSRAALWAYEVTGYSQDTLMTVVTQGANKTACAFYESFGFEVSTVQDVYHLWLPQHLIEPLSRFDKARLPFCKQHMTGKEQEYVSQVFASGLDSAARFTTMCSTKLQEILGPDSTRVVIVPSGTAALEMAALLLDLQPGDEVIMPSYTFSSTANAVVLRGAVPVFVDIREDTLNIDETLIEGAITAKTKAICCVHYAGIPCEMDTICEIAQRRGLYVIEDAAQGFQSLYKGRHVGTIGDFGCFSFHYTKNIICGEGGAISINRSPKLASRALVLWEKGTNRYDFMAGKLDKYEWVDIGSSYVPSEVSCAILYAQLEQSEVITNARLENFDRYAKALAPLVDRGIIRIPRVPSDCQHNAHIFYVIFRSLHTRQRAEEEFKKRGISAFSHYVPLHSSAAGKKFGKVGTTTTKGELPVTDAVFEGLLRLPIWIGLRLDEINYVIKSMHEICDVL